MYKAILGMGVLTVALGCSGPATEEASGVRVRAAALTVGGEGGAGVPELPPLSWTG